MHYKPRRDSGYIGTALVVAFALITLGSLMFVFRQNLRAHDAEVRSQIEVDYSQKEDAIIRALVAIVPNKAIGAMQQGSSLNQAEYSWETIFEEAIDLAGVEDSVDASVLTALNLDGHISANTGDRQILSSDEIVSPAVGTTGFVNAGNRRDTALMFDTSIGGKIPTPLTSTNSIFLLDQTYPVITTNKTYDSGWTAGLSASLPDYELYNLIEYPDIRFGFAKPGENFVAKRNWWVFSLTFGGQTTGDVTIPAVKKTYVLSIYEVPTQLPLSAGNYMNVGSHADGSAWTNITIDGGVFANELETDGNVNLNSGLFSGRQRLSIGAGTTVAGQAINGNIDDLGVRETFQANSDTDFYEASLASNAGRVAIVPLNRGNEYFELNGDGSNSERISPTGWNDYTLGAEQCAMRIRVERMVGSSTQMPTRVRFYYYSGGSRVNRRYTRDWNWPRENEPGGDAFPFQTDYLEVGRNALIFLPERLPAFLASIGGDDVTVNNSVYIYPDSTRTTVNAPNIPSTSDDMAVAIRECEDLSPFTEGLSIVSMSRFYFGESFNQVPITAPSGAGLPSGYEFYPPTSIFAPEKRYGTGAYDQRIVFEGQMSSLKEQSADAFRPMDLKDGYDDLVDAGQISAELKRLISPAELPPVFMMNWLVTVEEIQ